jgi:hypothetical protein
MTQPGNQNDQDRLRLFDYILFGLWLALPFAIFFYVRG